jgi:hypothetical protein
LNWLGAMLKLKAFFEKTLVEYNGWALYTLCFFVTVNIEHIVLLTKSFSTPNIYLHNSIRLLLLLVPVFLLFCFETYMRRKPAVKDLPILILGLCVLTDPMARYVYVAILVVFALVFRRLRKFFIVALPLVFFSISLLPNISLRRHDDINGSVLANVHTLQFAIETYAFDHDKAYPETLSHLEKVARSENYWKDFLNPSLSRFGYQGRTFSDISKPSLRKLHRSSVHGDVPAQSQYTYYLGIPIYSPYEELEGVYSGEVLYYRPSPFHYVLYGVDEHNRLIQDGHGQVFVLTNG